jgi:hypothetical protein
MKTALQEFIDNVIPMHIIELDMIKQEIKKALEKEKEQIIKAHNEGIWIEGKAFDDGEEYYNQTYNN